MGYEDQNQDEQRQCMTGLETHFEKFDFLTGGLQKSELIVVAARPSMGKTALAISIAENAAVLDKKVVAIFALETSNDALFKRMLCSQSLVDSHKLRTGFLGRDDFRRVVGGLESLLEAPIFIDDTPNLSISDMHDRCRRLRQTRQCLDLVIVDYLQLVSAAPLGVEGPRCENRTEEISAVIRGLKAMAKDLACPVVALCQLGRARESRSGNNRPQLSDLRESGSIEQDADVVTFIFREEIYKPDEPDLEGKAELTIAKQRNGLTGIVRLAFIKRSTRFENMAMEGGPGEY